MTDVTDEPAVAAAAELDERYHALAESLDAIVFVTDMQSRMRYANPALAHTTGLAAADFQFAQADNPFIHRDDAARVAAFLGAFVAGEARRSAPIENRFLDRWGRAHQMVSVVTKVHYGGAPALQFVCRPVAVAGEPSPGQREYLALIEAADDAILRLDGSGRILFANQRTEALTGLDRIALGKRGFVDLLEPDAREAVRARLASAPAPAGPCGERIATQLQTAGGDVRDVEVTLGSLAAFGADGEWLAIVRDVTRERAAAAERERLEQQLRDAQKLETVGGLAAGIAHDFNNLLAAVMTNVGLAHLELRRGDPAAAGTRLDEIQDAAARAATLCRQLLAYTGRAPVRVETVDVHAVVDDLAQIIAAALAGRGRVRRARDAHPALVTADAAQLQQLVMNLSMNALDALGDRGGEIVLETAAYRHDGADIVVLRVSDNGSGMDEATRARMFDPYFTTKGLGRGLGLAGVLGVVRGHHGVIEVDSAPGRGTTVEVRLPAARPAIAAPVDEDDDDIAGWRATGTIIVADDEPAVRTAIAMVLADAGFTVVEAGDGAEGIDALASHPAAVAVVFDATMPNLGGVDALRRLRAAGNRVPALLISGYQETTLTPSAAASLRPLRFLGKPFELDELLRALRYLLLPPA